jgi:pantothenate kinase-related protein Tda10
MWTKIIKKTKFDAGEVNRGRGWKQRAQDEIRSQTEGGSSNTMREMSAEAYRSAK